MQVTANVFITAIHGLGGDTPQWYVRKVLLRHPLHHGLWRQCSLFVRSGGQKESSLSDFVLQASTGLFYNKSIICFNKLSVNTCEKNDFLKAFDALQG